MAYTVYVLQSLKNGRRYVGVTSLTVRERLRQHHNGSSRWTRQNGPFKLIYTEEIPERVLAYRRERLLKSGHGRQFLNQIIPR